MLVVYNGVHNESIFYCSDIYIYIHAMESLMEYEWTRMECCVMLTNLLTSHRGVTGMVGIVLVREVISKWPRVLVFSR